MLYSAAMNNLDIPQAPPRGLLLRETRAVVDLALLPLNFIGIRRVTDHEAPVIVLPGFGAGERAMRPLRLFLQRSGFQAEDWGLGINKAGLDIPHRPEDLGPTWPRQAIEPYRREGGVAYLVDRMAERVLARAELAGSPVTLVGWSLGGTIAREVARDVPRAVSHVVTLGSPIIGGPKYTAAAARLASRGLNLDWIEQQVRQREERPVTVPITALVSPSDAIVDFRAARDHYSKDVEHVEVDVAHLSMGFNRQVSKLIARSLRRQADSSGERAQSRLEV